MTTQILQQLEHHQQAWPMHASWVSSSSAWSKQRVTVDHSSDSSWEVRAFAEDASSSGQWPPRSYSCSFCQREFRTAQALGGHMNVHRRERAHQNQLASRNLRVSSSSKSHQPTTTVDLLSPKAEQRSLSTLTDPSTTTTTTAALSSSPPSQESINSCCSLISPPQEEQITKPLLNLDILCETLSQQRTDVASWTPPSRALYYHPYEKSSAAARCKPAHSSGSPGRFSLCLNKVMGEVHEDVLVDLELRLGRSSCAV